MQQGIMTARGLKALRVGEWASDPAERGSGRLQARRTAAGVVFYYRYTAPNNERVRIPLGAFDAQGRNGLDLIEARDRSGDLSRRYRAGERDLRAALAEEQRAVDSRRAAQCVADETEAARKAGTLGRLLTLYVDMLEARGRASAHEVANVIRLHVKETAPKLWTRPAVDVSASDVLDLLSPLVKAGKKRTADKLRAILRAGYATAIRSHRNAAAPAELRALRIKANPAADAEPIEGARNARDRALSVAELRAYWQRINRLPAVDRALLRFHLLTGAQRLAMLERVTLNDWDTDAHLLTLTDPKGRRSEPRRHAVPLLPDAEEAMQVMRKAEAGPYLFTVTGGLSGASYFIAQTRLRAVSAAMVEAGEASAAFTLGDLRRTVETRLAALGVSQDTRAHLQSHGLGGVQARHYDRHSYLPEKRAALETLLRLLTDTRASVTPIKRKTG